MRYKHTRKIITESSMLNEGAMQWILGIIAAVGGIGMAYHYREQIAELLRKINPSIGDGFLMFMNLIGGGIGKAKDSVVSGFGGQTNQEVPNNSQSEMQSQDPKAYAQYKIDQLKKIPFMNAVESAIASGTLPPEIVQNLPVIMNSPTFAKYKDLSVYDAIQLASSKDASPPEQNLAIQIKAMIGQELKIPSNQLWSEIPSNTGNVNTIHSTPNLGHDLTKARELMPNPLNLGGQSPPAQPVAQSEPNPQLNNSDFEKQSQHYEPSYPTIQNDLKNIATGASNIGSGVWNWAKETGGNIADWVKQKYDYYGSMTPEERVKTESVMYIKRLNEIATPAQPPLPAGVPSAPMPAPATPPPAFTPRPPIGFTPAPPVKQSPAPTPPPAQAPPATPGSPMLIVPTPKKPTGAPPEFIKNLRIEKRIR